MIFFKRFFVLVLFFAFVFKTQAQIEAGFLPLEIEQNKQITDYYISNSDKKFHSSFQPYFKQTILKNDTLKSNCFILSDKNKYDIYVFKDSLSRITINATPLIQSEIGYDALRNNSSFFQSGGLRITTSIGSKFSIQSLFKAGLIRESNFIDTIIESSRIIPGLGIAYLQKQDNTYSFQMHGGELGRFQIEAGHEGVNQC